MRSYSSIEEMDQEAVDLQGLPFIPMLSSVWLNGLKMLFAQSVGLSGHDTKERGVIARMMPRALAAIVVIAIGVSCIRVVQPGQVAVLERLGYAPFDEKTGQLMPGAVLKPGLHWTLPWPMDELVYIPTEQLQLTDVGAELHAPKEYGKAVDFQFWTVEQDKDPTQVSEDEFLTADPGRQILETYVQVRWRVADPVKFYSALSHSEFYEREKQSTKALPIFEAMIQQCTSYAVTQTFATHEMEHILITGREETEYHCKSILQQKLDKLGSGIEVVNLTIKDLHPPYWQADRPNDPTAPLIWGQRVARGPARAFEFVVTSRSIANQVINLATAQRDAMKELAVGDAKVTKADAEDYALKKIAAAEGEAARLGTALQYLPKEGREVELGLLEQQMMYKTMTDVFTPVNKIIVDPAMKDNLQIIQTTENGRGVMPMPAGQ
jgi:regulator of protease activity HflC (stomatin/prohibitin superfamily)